jgi:uncharacterized protein YciI
MNYYLLIYHVADDYLARRAEFRKEHLQLAEEAHKRGELLLGGALEDPPDQALLLFRTDDSEGIKDFILKDPYVRNGIVKSWEIRLWNVVVGENAADPV